MGTLRNNPDTGSVSLIWTGVPGQTYTVDVRTGFVSEGIWSPIVIATARAAASVFTLANQEEPIGRVRFYRIRLGD